MAPVSGFRGAIQMMSAVLALTLPTACGSGTSHRHLGPTPESHVLVGRGDTLESVAKAFSTSVDWLKKRNRLDGSPLVPGQTLIVPAGQAQPWRDER